MLKKQTGVISALTGKFIDQDLEKQYRDSTHDRFKAQLQKMALIIGIIFTLFLIYDWLTNRGSSHIPIILFCRLLIIALCLILYLNPKCFLNSSLFLKATIYELLIIVLVLTIMVNYENPHFLLQAIAINAIILGIFFLIPNLLQIRIALSFFALICFWGITVIKHQPSLFEVAAVFSYLLLSIIICVISSYILDIYMRLEYLSKNYYMELSWKDSLTDTYNRLKFYEALEREIELAKRYGNIFSLIMFDIDHFKIINDKNGHTFGDKALVELTNLVKTNIREVDLFCRWGGDEFIIILPHTGIKDASILAERLKTTISEELLRKNLILTCSFGVTCFSAADDTDSIMQRVDAALYRAKGSGRNVVVVQPPD